MPQTSDPRDPRDPLHPADPGDRGPEALRRAMRSPSRGQVVVAVLLALLGFAAVTQIRSTESQSTYSGLREQELIDVLDGLAGSTQRVRAEIEDLTRAREQLQSESTRRGAALAQAQGEVENLQVLAGTVPVTGPGIRVTITEETGPLTVRAFVDTLEELRTVGAEAVQVNGRVRVVAQTPVEQGVGGLLVDGVLVESPYVVDVIGTPTTTLASAITFYLGPQDTLERGGAAVVVDELATLDIDTVRTLPDTEYAEPEG